VHLRSLQFLKGSSCDPDPSTYRVAIVKLQCLALPDPNQIYAGGPKI